MFPHGGLQRDVQGVGIDAELRRHLRRDARRPVEPGVALGAGQLEDVGDGLRPVDQFMFDDMNQGFFGIANFEFQQSQQKTIRAFLTRFDAIFTLNQDLLLEHHYIDHDVSLLSSGRWGGSALPGMRPFPNPDAANPNSWAQRKWTPADQAEFAFDGHHQPYFKLHGSSNWHETHGAPMLIMGGNKIREIGLSPVLSWYHQQFEERLYQPDTRLMIIG